MALSSRVPKFSVGEDFSWIGDVGEDISDSGWECWSGLFTSKTQTWSQGIGVKKLSTSSDVTKLDEPNGLFLIRMRKGDTTGKAPGVWYIYIRVLKPLSGEFDIGKDRIVLVASPTDTI
jgi:hypothetical protein